MGLRGCGEVTIRFLLGAQFFRPFFFSRCLFLFGKAKDLEGGGEYRRGDVEEGTVEDAHWRGVVDGVSDREYSLDVDFQTSQLANRISF